MTKLCLRHTARPFMQRTAALTRNFVFCKETAMTTTRQDLQRPLIGPSIFWSPCSCPHRAPWALFFSSPQISAHSTQHQKAHGALYFAIDILGRPKDLERAPPAPHRTWLSGSRLQTLHIHTRLKRDLKHARETVSVSQSTAASVAGIQATSICGGFFG